MCGSLQKKERKIPNMKEEKDKSQIEIMFEFSKSNKRCDIYVYD